MSEKLFKFGAYVTRWKEDKHGNMIGRAWTEEIHFRLPASAEHTDAVFAKAKETAAKRWKRCWEVTETWMCPIR